MIKYFVIRNFRGRCSFVEVLKGTRLSVEMLKRYVFCCRNAEEVHGKRMFGNPRILYSEMQRTYSTLFCAYCLPKPMYACQLWSKYTQTSMKRSQVAYTNACPTNYALLNNSLTRVSDSTRHESRFLVIRLDSNHLEKRCCEDSTWVHSCSNGGPKGPCPPPEFSENIVILCFERHLSKQNSVIRLISNILAPQNFLSSPKFLSWLRHCMSHVLSRMTRLEWKLMRRIRVMFTKSPIIWLTNQLLVCTQTKNNLFLFQ